MTAPVDILVVGAGPTGLTLALQAHDHGATVRIVDRRVDAFRPSRALILHARTLEVLRPLGVTTALLGRADTDPEVRLHLGRRVVPVRLGRLDLPDTAFPHLTLMRQMDVESILLDALGDRGITVERDTEVIDTGEGTDAAWATLRTPTGTERVTCRFLAGCDGPDSIVRRQAGIAWRGGSYREEIVLADIELDATPPRGGADAHIGRRGLLLLFPLGEQATWRVLATRPARGAPLPFGHPGPPLSLGELQGLLDTAGTAGRIAELAWSARYSVQHRLAATFRKGRRVLAGDAAHNWSPAVGQGMNTGIQDAVNLGWKLAFAPTATDPDTLLDSYDLERRPAARRVLAMTHFAFWGEGSRGPIPSLLRGLAPLGAPTIPLLLRHRRLVAEGMAWISQLRASYPRGPLCIDSTPPALGDLRAGDRLPNTIVTVGGREVRLHELTATPGVHLLLHRDAALPAAIRFGDRVTAHLLNSAPPGRVVAVRPDGYIGFRATTANLDPLAAWLAGIGVRRAELRTCNN